MTEPDLNAATDAVATHDDVACAQLFTDTLSRLNEISERQMRAILDLAFSAATAARSIEPSSPNSSAVVEKVTALFDDLKAKLIKPDSEVVSKPVPEVKHNATTAAGRAFCDSVRNDLAIAIANSTSNQQQLNVIGAAVVTQGASLVLSAGKENGG